MTTIQPHADPTWAEDASGYTLVEMLVVVSLLGLLSVGMASALGLGLHAWQGTKTTTDRSETILTAHSTLRNAIQTIYPRWETPDPLTGHVYFDGTSNSMSFMAQAPAAIGVPGWIRYSIEATTTGRPASLVVKLYPSPQDSTTPIVAAESVVADNLSEISFAYYGPSLVTDAPVWHSNWTNRSRLPLLIRMTATDSTGMPWPTLIASPRINVDVVCDFDPLTHRCRGRP